MKSENVQMSYFSPFLKILKCCQEKFFLQFFITKYFKKSLLFDILCTKQNKMVVVVVDSVGYN